MKSKKHYGRALEVIDGDTFIFKPFFGKPINIRLFAVDAWELDQRGGQRARKYLSWLLSWSIVRVIPQSSSYHRIVAKVHTLSLVGWWPVGAQLVFAGDAVIDARYAKNDVLLKWCRRFAVIRGAGWGKAPRYFRK